MKSLRPRLKIRQLAAIILLGWAVIHSHLALASVAEIVDRVTAAYGGLEKLQTIKTIEYELTGYRISRHQSRRTEPPYDRVPVSSFAAIDYENDHGVVDGVGNYPGGLIFPFRSILGPEGDISLDTEQKTFHRGMAMTSLNGLKSAASRNLPPLLARAMNKNIDSLELLGTKSHLGQDYLHLELGETGILVHPVTHLIYATLTTRNDISADRPLEVMRIYRNTIEQDGIYFPLAVFDYLPAEKVFLTDFRLTHLELNTDITPYLSIPDDFVAGANPHMGYANDGELMARELGPGVFLAGDNNTNVLYVEFDDYFVAMESGGMAWYVESVFEVMQPHMNDKPLRYIVPTHYHDDHAAGLRFYTRIGATILTTPEKAGYLRELLKPIDDGKWVDKMKFEWITGTRHSLEDQTGALDVRVYPNSPHAENMLVGYLPRSHINFSADLFIGWGGTPDIRQGASAGLRHYAVWLRDQLGEEFGQLRTWVPVHGRPYSATEIQTMLDRPKTFVRLPGNREVSADDWFVKYGLNDETVSGRRDYLNSQPMN